MIYSQAAIRQEKFERAEWLISETILFQNPKAINDLPCSLLFFYINVNPLREEECLFLNVYTNIILWK